MNQEDKELIVKDLLPRLFHCVKVNVSGDWFYDERQPYDTTICLENCKLLRDFLCEENLVIKPYLRLMSSMTDEETSELYEAGFCDNEGTPADIEGYIDWLVEHNFDYRELIEKGLALEQK